MYGAFYHLSEKPFQIDTDPRFLWYGAKHEEAMANLRYGLMNGNGVSVLTGDIGTGKTTLINALVKTFDDRVLIAKINHPSLDSIEFLTLVAKTFDASVAIDGKSDLLLFFNRFLQQVRTQNKIALLIIDEAHHLSTELLEEIRLLGNIEHAGKSLLNIILVGQNELGPMLFSQQCRALRQRITQIYEIPALSLEETEQYVGYRLRVSGQMEQLFSPAALQKIHDVSAGNPRLINLVCDRALLTGFVQERIQVDADIIVDCARELNLRDQTTVMRPKHALPNALAWTREFLAESATGMTAVKQLLLRTSRRVWDGRAVFVAAIWTQAKSVAIFAIDTGGRFVRKYRRQIITCFASAGITVLSLTVAIGAYRVAGVLRGQPVTGQSPALPKPKAAHVVQNQDGAGTPPTIAARAVDIPPADSKPVNPESDIAAPLGHQLAGSNRPDPIYRDTIGQSQPTVLETAVTALAQRDFQKAVALFEAIQSDGIDPPSETKRLYAEALVGRADEMMTVSPREAENLLRKATATAPDFVEPYRMLGKHYIHTKDFARAIEAYQDAARLDPESSNALFNLGFAYATSGDFESAEKAFFRVVQLNPPYLGKALFNLAVVQHRLGKKKESIANLEIATAMAPNNKKAAAFLNRLRGTTPDFVAKEAM